MNNAYLMIGSFGSLDWNAGIYDALSGVSRLAVHVRNRANVISLAFTLHKVNKSLAELFKTVDGIMDGTIKPDPPAKPVTNDDVRAMGYTLNQLSQTMNYSFDSLARVGLNNNSLTAGSMRSFRAYSERILDLVDWIEAIQLPDHVNDVFARSKQERERGELFDLAQVQ